MCTVCGCGSQEGDQKPGEAPKEAKAHGHSHAHGDHDHDHHHHHGHGHGHGHEHALSNRGLLAMGASAGLIPCPSALVVLLGAIAQAQIVLGLALIVAFSLGLAATLTVLGLAVVWTSGRVSALPAGGAGALAVRVLPVASAVVIVALGAVLTLRAVPMVV
jgi:ABC-type nickel/cobalt efflux system permease component RcnA